MCLLEVKLSGLLDTLVRYRKLHEGRIPNPTPASKSSSVLSPSRRYALVEACGVCGRDVAVVLQTPRVPGHEVVGLIDAVGADVPDWKLEWVGMAAIAALVRVSAW